MEVALRSRAGSGPRATASARAEVVAAGRAWSGCQYRLVRAVAALDESGEWALAGAPTCAHWVADALDVEVCTAREWVRIGRALVALRAVDRAFAAGRLSYSKVRAVTRVATAATEVELCELAQRLPAGRVPCALAAWLTRHEAPAETERRQHAARSLTWHTEPDGMVAGTFRLAPIDAALVTTAVDTAVLRHRPAAALHAQRGADASADASTPRTVAAWPSMIQQRADALVALIAGGGAGVTTEVVLHVRADGCSLDDGTPIAGSIVERLVPTAFVRALVHDAASRPIDASRRRRHPSARQRRVVRERDRACVDCGTTAFCEFDHDPPYEQTGRTVIDELRLRCWTCHHARHRDDPHAA